jgi:hypothetical protein
MILATRIPGMTAQMRRATIQAAEGRTEGNDVQHLIVELERRGYRVTRVEQAA